MDTAELAREEGMKRQVNEAIEGGLWPDERHATVRMRCECGSQECNGFVEISVPEYERIRRRPRRFVLLRGHQASEAEEVVRRDPGYVVVEKVGQAGEAAERSDPRTGTSDSDPRAGTTDSDPRTGTSDEPAVS